MNPDLVFSNIKESFDRAFRGPDAPSDLESMLLVLAPQYDDAAEYNANAWIDKEGFIYPGFYALTKYKETYVVIFRECQLVESDRIANYALRLAKEATVLEKQYQKPPIIN